MGGDTDKGFYGCSADQFGIVTNGIQRLNITNSELVANDPGNDVDFRVETSGNANALFIDGANDNIGIGTGTLNNSAQLTLGDSNRGILLNQWHLRHHFGFPISSLSYRAFSI